MIYIKAIIDIVGVVIEALIVFSFFKMFMPIKYNEKVNTLSYFAYVLISSLISIFVDLEIVLFLRELVLILAVTFLYNGGIMKKILLAFSSIILLLLAEFVVGLLTMLINHVEIDTIQSNLFYYFEGAVISKLLLLIVIKICENHIKPHEVKMSNAMTIVLLSLPVATFFIVLTISEYASTIANNKASIMMFIASLILVIANISFVFLLEHELKQVEKQKQEEMRHSQLENQVNYYKKILDDKLLYNKKLHDLKNKLYAVQNLIKNDDAVGKKEIQELCENMATDTAVKYTQNDSLNSLIYAKLTQNIDMNIVFKCDSVMNMKNEVSDVDLCVIVGNTLDNAIEECRKNAISNPEIKMRINQQGNYLLFNLSNPTMLNNQKDSKRTFKTTKENNFLHGYGLQNVHDLCVKYNGNDKIIINDGIFTINIILCNRV